MFKKKTIIGICGSASSNSANLSILKQIAQFSESHFELDIIDDLSILPHFKTALTDKDTPEIITKFREKIKNADGVIICTPEYVFSIPSGLKNMIEWCVSTTVFSEKPIGLITASASGVKAHEALKLIMETIQTHFTPDTTLLIQGIKGKVNEAGEISEPNTMNALIKFTDAFRKIVGK